MGDIGFRLEASVGVFGPGTHSLLFFGYHAGEEKYELHTTLFPSFIAVALSMYLSQRSPRASVGHDRDEP